MVQIMVVDDEEHVRDLWQRILTDVKDVSVIYCENGIEATEKYEENRGKIDLIILDIEMPQLSGDQAYQRIKEINPQARVLITSGYPLEEEKGDMFKDPYVSFLSKPFRPNEGFEMVEEILDS